MADDVKKTDPAPHPKGAGAMKWVLFGVFFALLAGGVAGGVLWFLLRPQPPVEAGQQGEGSEASGEAHGEAATVEPKGLIPLDQFLVNLADKDANRFVRVTIQLAVEDEKVAVEIGESPVSRARIRSTVLEVLTQQTSDRLVTPEGKTELKKAIAERVSAALAHVKVLDVLFTDFVVQF